MGGDNLLSFLNLVAGPFPHADTRKWKEVDVIAETDDPSIPIRGGVPPRRYGHACCCYNGKIYMFGGRNDDDGSLGVMECYDIGTCCALSFVHTYEISYIHREKHVALVTLPRQQSFTTQCTIWPSYDDIRQIPVPPRGS